MEEQLSLLDLVLNASLTVQAVMLLLLLASVLSWFMIAQRLIYYRHIRDEMYGFEEQFWSGIDLNKLYREGNERAEAGHILGMEGIFRAGFKEFSRLAQQGLDTDDIVDGVQRVMRVALSREEERLERHLPFLASGNAQQATLAMVAPGIAEALIATAMGLFAAIPAVMAYNRFAAKLDTYLNRYEAFTDEFSSILLRQAHAVKTRSRQA